MNTQQWRELIEAYVEGRLSADAFKRRFQEAFETAVSRRLPTHAAVQELAYTVQAYAGDPTARGHDVADDRALMSAAERALSRLPETVAAPETGYQAPPPPFEANRPGQGPYGVPPRARVFAINMGALGAVGCLGLLGVALVLVLQFFAIAEQLSRVLDWGPAPSTLLAVPVAFTPILGGVVAFFGAKDAWGWHPLLAGLVFLAAPAATAFGAWRRWRRERG